MSFEALNAAVRQYLASIYRDAIRTYPAGTKPHKFNLSTRSFGDKVNHRTLVTLFGFVPVFTRTGETEIYVRLGGPERTVKMTGNWNKDPDSGLAYGHYDTKSDRVRNGAGFDFGTKYNKLMGGGTSYNTLYDIKLSERHGLQEAVLGLPLRDPRISEERLADLRRLYKFKLVPTADHQFELLYSHEGSPYLPLKTSDAAYKGLGADLIFDTLDHEFAKHGADIEILKETLVQAKTEAGQTEAMGLLLRHLADDFKHAAMDGLTHGAWFMSPLHDNALDQVWWSAFIQLLQHTDWNENAGVDLVEGKVDICAEAIASTENILPKCKTALKEDVDRTLSRYSLDSEAAVEVIKQDSTLRDEAVALRKKVKKLESQKKHTSVHRYVGLAAGAGAAYLSVHNRDDLEDWQKATVVAVGGVLGMVPVLNYLTIAATPILVSKGIEYAQSFSSPVSSTQLISTDTAEA